MFVSMDVMNINNGSSGHFDVSNVEEETPSRIANGTTESGKFENQMSEGERSGRKRKTRRFKSRYKGKSFTSKTKYGILKKMRTNRTYAYPQSEAPSNTNEFLMAVHTIENLDDALSREKRHRESSFTSVDSDDEQFYSSPEDEDEFLTKDFDKAYQSMCDEKFGKMSKSQLTKIIIELEAKVDELNKKLATNSKLEEMSSMLMQMNALENKDEIRMEIKDVLTENERLRRENEELRQLATRDSSSSSSTSSSGESESDSEVEANAGENRTDQRAS